MACDRIMRKSSLTDTRRNIGLERPNYAAVDDATAYRNMDVSHTTEAHKHYTMKVILKIYEGNSGNLDKLECVEKLVSCLVELYYLVSCSTWFNSDVDRKINVLLSDLGVACKQLDLDKGEVLALTKNRNAGFVVPRTLKALVQAFCSERYVDIICHRSVDWKENIKCGFNLPLTVSQESFNYFTGWTDCHIYRYFNPINNDQPRANINRYGDSSYITSNGAMSLITSNGNNATINSSGFRSRITSNGNNATINSSGSSSFITSNAAKAKVCAFSSGTVINSYGEGAMINSNGKVAEIYSYGENAKIYITYEEIPPLNVVGQNLVIYMKSNEMTEELINKLCQKIKFPNNDEDDKESFANNDADDKESFATKMKQKNVLVCSGGKIYHYCSQEKKFVEGTYPLVDINNKGFSNLFDESKC